MAWELGYDFIRWSEVSFGAKRELKCNIMLLTLLARQTISSEIRSEQRNSVGILLGI